jgi:hypothetical protein
MNEPTALDHLAYQLEIAKEAEAEARDARLEIEQELVSLLTLKDEGSTTEKGEFYKVTATTSMTRKITDLSGLHGAVGDKVFADLVVEKHELNLKTLRGLQQFQPDVALEASRYIETKPSKPSLKVARVASQASDDKQEQAA